MNELIVPRSQRVHRYTTYGLLTQLTIDAAVLIEDLLDNSRRDSLYPVLSRVTSLRICMLAECAWMFREPFTLDTFFSAIQGMGHLRQFTIEGFSLPTPEDPPFLPICLFRSPIPINSLTVHKSHGTSLRFLLDCFEPDELLLESCWFTTNLPDCDRLTLRHIQRFDGFAEVLAAWDGDELIIDSCPFLDERFVAELRRNAVGNRESLWQDASVFLHGCGFAIRRRIVELHGLDS